MSDTVQTAVYRMAYDTGDSAQKVEQLRGATERLVTITEGQGVVQEKVTKSTRTTTDAMDRMLARLDPRIRAEQNLQRVIEQINRLREQGIGTETQYARVIELAQQKVDRFTAANDNSQTVLSRFQQGLIGVNRVLGPFGIALSAAAAVNFARSIFENAANLDEQALQIGVNVEALQAYRAVMLQSGIDNATSDRIMQRLTRTIGEATAAAGSQRDAFIELGITARDLAGGTEAVLPKVAAALLAIENANTRARLEADLFGRTGQKLESALRALVDPTSTLIEKQRALGQIMGTEVTAAADTAADALTAAWNRVKVGTAPGITWLMEKLAWIIEKSREVDEYVNFWGRGDAARKAREQANQPGIPALTGVDTGNLLINGQPRTGGGFSDSEFQKGMSALRERAAMVGKERADVDAIVALRELEAKKIKEGNGLLTEPERKEITRNATAQARYDAAQKAAKDAEDARKKELDDLERFEGWINKLVKEQDDLAEKERRRAADQKQRQADYIQDLRDDLTLAGMSRDEAERKAAVLRGVRDLHIEAGSAQAREIENLVRARQETERWRSVVDDIAGGFQNAFENIFENGISKIGDLWAVIKRQFIQLLAYMASQALVMPVIIPIVTEVFGGAMGGLSGLFGGGGSSLGLLANGASLGSRLGLFGSSGGGLFSDLFGGAGLINGLGGMLGFATAAPITAALPSFSVAMPGLAAGYGSSMTVAPGLLNTGVMGTQAGSLFGSLSLGSFLGGTGLGALAGNMLFGNRNSAGIGSMGGAAAGALAGTFLFPGVGTILGGLIGGIAGGGLGSLTGTSNQGAIANFNAGGLSSYLFKQGGGNNGEMSMKAAGAISEAIKSLGAVGVNVGLGNISGLSIGSDKSYVYDYAGGKQKLGGGDVEGVVNAILNRILPSATGTTAEAQAVLAKYQAAGGVNAGNLQQLASDLGAAKNFADALANLRDADKVLSDFGQKLKRLNEEYDALAGKASELGLGIEGLVDARRGAIRNWFDGYLQVLDSLIPANDGGAWSQRAQAIALAEQNAAEAARELGEGLDIVTQKAGAAYAAMATDFNSSISAAILAITDPAQAAYSTMLEKQAQRIREATAAGGDLNEVYRLNSLEQEQVAKAQEALVRQNALKILSGEIGELTRMAKDAANVAQRAAQQWGRAHETIDQAARNLLLSDQSLSPLDRYNNARAEAERLRTAGLGGSATDAAGFASFTTQFLQASSAFNASGPAYHADRAYVSAALAELGKYTSGQKDVAERQAESTEAALPILEAIAEGIAEQTEENKKSVAQLTAEVSSMKREINDLTSQLRMAG